VEARDQLANEATRELGLRCLRLVGRWRQACPRSGPRRPLRRVCRADRRPQPQGSSRTVVQRLV